MVCIQYRDITMEQTRLYEMAPLSETLLTIMLQREFHSANQNLQSRRPEAYSIQLLPTIVLVFSLIVLSQLETVQRHLRHAKVVYVISQKHYGRYDVTLGPLNVL